jgi:hypothetical protein
LEVDLENVIIYFPIQFALREEMDGERGRVRERKESRKVGLGRKIKHNVSEE